MYSQLLYFSGYWSHLKCLVHIYGQIQNLLKEDAAHHPSDHGWWESGMSGVLRWVEDTRSQAGNRCIEVGGLPPAPYGHFCCWPRLTWGKGEPTTIPALLQLGAVEGSYAGLWVWLDACSFLLPVSAICPPLFPMPPISQEQALERETWELLLSLTELSAQWLPVVQDRSGSPTCLHQL